MSCRFNAKVTTGDRKDAGTNAIVWLQLVDSTGKHSEKTKLDKLLVDDHQAGSTAAYDVREQGLAKPDEIDYITIWRERLLVCKDKWFLEKIVLDDSKTKKSYIFPVHRWIDYGKQYSVRQFDTSLPQDVKDPEWIKMRKEELGCKRMHYDYKDGIKGGPKQQKELPEDEMHSEKYLNDLHSLQAKLKVEAFLAKYTTGRWASIDDCKSVYSDPVNTNFKKPQSVDHWTEDRWFGLERLQGACPNLITLCTKIPEKLGVEASDLEPSLEGLTVQDALEMKKLFLIDLEMLEGVPCKMGLTKMIAPICLLYLNKKKELLPIAIQLHQKKEASNPVFLPSDPAHTWIMAKMYYNLAECQVHQGAKHVSFTHQLMETICIAAHRNLSLSHPMFRLLAPHFLFLMGTNKFGLNEAMYAKDGWIEVALAAGSGGTEEVIARAFKKWNLSVEGNFEKEIEARGLLDREVLPNYPYRDDGVPFFKIIKKYVTGIVKHFYGSNDKLVADYEAQEWVKELSKPQAQGGCGVGGMPQKLDTLEQLIDICTAIISSCTMIHAAVNFAQYNSYSFQPNYPTMLMKDPPKDKKAVTEKDLVDLLPSKMIAVKTMVTTTILSTKSTLSLGDFELQYLYNPEAVAIANEFRNDLKSHSMEIKAKNKKRETPYDYLDPEGCPNSISI